MQFCYYWDCMIFHVLSVLFLNCLRNEVLLLWSQCPNKPLFRVEVLVTESCLTLCDPLDCSLPSSSVHGILQASTPQRVAISFPRGSPRPRDGTQVVAGRFFTVWATVRNHITRASRTLFSSLTTPQMPPAQGQDSELQQRPSLAILSGKGQFIAWESPRGTEKQAGGSPARKHACGGPAELLGGQTSPSASGPAAGPPASPCEWALDSAPKPLQLLPPEAGRGCPSTPQSALRNLKSQGPQWVSDLHRVRAAGEAGTVSLLMADDGLSRCGESPMSGKDTKRSCAAKEMARTHRNSGGPDLCDITVPWDLQKLLSVPSKSGSWAPPHPLVYLLSRF